MDHPWARAIMRLDIVHHPSAHVQGYESREGQVQYLFDISRFWSGVALEAIAPPYKKVSSHSELIFALPKTES
jgi:hypothetical protein